MTTVDPNKVQLAEKDIEDWLYEHPQSLGVEKWIGRQVEVVSGIIDLLGYEPNGAVVVEVKNVPASAEAILQVCRYAHDIDQMIPGDMYVRKVLVVKGDLSDKLMYEANAVEVECRSFSVNLYLSIGGPWNWTEEAQKSHLDKIQKIGEPLYQIYSDLDRLEDISDTVEDIVEKNEGEDTPKE